MDSSEQVGPYFGGPFWDAKEWVGRCLEDMLLKMVDRLEEMKEIWLSGYALIRSIYIVSSCSQSTMIS